MMRAVERILAIFESFTSARSTLSLQEITDLIELPKSTTFRIVQSLEQAGYLVRLPDQKYCLSFRFIRLAGLVDSTLGIREIARPIMTDLTEKTKETVALHTVSDGNRVCIDAISATSSQLRSVMQPGEQIPLLVGSASKLLMAYMPEAELTPVLANVVQTTKRAQAEVLAEFGKIRKQGYAVSHGERLPGLSAISAPIRNINDEVRYCLTVNGPTIRIRPKEEELIQMVMKAAEDIALHFGG